MNALPTLPSLNYSQQPQLKSKTCEDCNQSFNYQALTWIGDREAFTPPCCPECQRLRSFKIKQEQEAERARRLEYERGRRALDWCKTMCPPLYSQFDPAKLPCKPEIIQEVMGWQYGPRGLMLYGPTGLGKTRLAYLLLQRLYVDEGRWIMSFTPTQFTQECIKQCLSEDGGASWFRELREANITFFDDFGRFKFSERVEAEIFNLFEARLSQRRPIILTTNFGGRTLRSRMSADYRDPFMRRLGEEFFDHIEFKAK